MMQDNSSMPWKNDMQNINCRINGVNSCIVRIVFLDIICKWQYLHLQFRSPSISLIYRFLFPSFSLSSYFPSIYNSVQVIVFKEYHLCFTASCELLIIAVNHGICDSEDHSTSYYLQE